MGRNRALSYVCIIYGNIFLVLQIQKLIAYEYLGRCPETNFTLFNALDQMVADSDFVCSVEGLAEKLSKNGNNVFR